LQKKGLIRVKHIPADDDDGFDLDIFQRKLEEGNVRLVSLAYTSNLTGYTLPAGEITKLAHAHGAKVLFDAAQTISHRAIDVQDLDIDFMAFSLHKMCGPRGVGVLYGKQEYLGQAQHEEDDPEDALTPGILGGGTVVDTTYDTYSLLELPERFEVGLQNFPGLIASGTAVEYLRQISMDKIKEHVNSLNSYLTDQLLAKYGDSGWFRILGPVEAGERAGILTFEVQRPNAVGITEELSDRHNIMIRDGAFCVHSYLNYRFGQGWIHPRLPSEHRMTYRVSMYFYNTLEECRAFLEALDDIFRERSYI
jgi:cysteine desulfurase/selenocysteine lyase